jgi:hypothetical protein
MIAPVDQRDVDRLAGQPLGSSQPTESGADDDDLGQEHAHLSGRSSPRQLEARRQ